MATASGIQLYVRSLSPLALSFRPRFGNLEQSSTFATTSESISPMLFPLRYCSVPIDLPDLPRPFREYCCLLWRTVRFFSMPSALSSVDDGLPPIGSLRLLSLAAFFVIYLLIRSLIRPFSLAILSQFSFSLFLTIQLFTLLSSLNLSLSPQASHSPPTSILLSLPLAIGLAHFLSLSPFLLSHSSSISVRFSSALMQAN